MQRKLKRYDLVCSPNETRDNKTFCHPATTIGSLIMVTTLQDFGLSKLEILQLINLTPRSDVEVSTVSVELM